MPLQQAMRLVFNRGAPLDARKPDRCCIGKASRITADSARSETFLVICTVSGRTTSGQAGAASGLMQCGIAAP